MASNRYTTVLLDLDHTLLDSDQSERLAFRRTLLSAGVDDPEGHLETYQLINRRLWAEVEAGTRTPDEVKVQRFIELAAELQTSGFESLGEPASLAETYALGLGEEGDLYPGALEVVVALAKHHRLGLVTNGLSAVQRTRIGRLGLLPYFDAVVISAEVGTAKPEPDIFDIVFDQLGSPDRASTLMVGDSLSSDIRGGANYGIDTCWYNPGGKVATGSLTPTHEVRNLAEVLTVADGS